MSEEKAILSISVKDARTIVKWVVLICTPLFALQTGYLKHGQADESVLLARQDSLHKVQMQKVAAFAEIVGNHSDQNAEMVIEFLKSPILDDLESLKSKMATMATAAEKSHEYTTELQTRSKLETLLELKRIETELSKRDIEQPIAPPKTKKNEKSTSGRGF